MFLAYDSPFMNKEQYEWWCRPSIADDDTNPADGSDVMERMIKAGCAATSDFEWLSQLRFVFSREEGPFGIVSVRQTNCQLEYSYEYQVRSCRAPWRSET